MNFHLIFDLDGTIVDSAPLILDCLSDVLNNAGITPKIQLSKAMIGPPLHDTIANIIGSRDISTISALSDEFKSRYDELAGIKTSAYPGMVKVLRELNEMGYQLHLATNKRLKPTQDVISSLDIAKYFEFIYAIDSFAPSFQNKSHMIKVMIQNGKIEKRYICYIGDKEEDGFAADKNEISFLGALWGYGDWKDCFNTRWQYSNTPEDLLGGIKAIQKKSDQY